MTDQEILRELANAYMEAANEPVNAERRERAYATNGLQAVRPLVWIHELPWHELNIDDALTLRCEGALAREIESELQNSLRAEITTTEIGEIIMDKLKALDAVSYVRFASVYREFKDVATFMEELERLNKKP